MKSQGFTTNVTGTTSVDRQIRVRFARKTRQICNDDASGMRQIYDKKSLFDKMSN